MIRLLICLFALCTYSLSAQDCPYIISQKKELISYSSLAVSFGMQIVSTKQLQKLSDTEIQNLSLDNLPKIDKKWYQDYSTKHARYSDYAAGTGITTAICLQAITVFSHSHDKSSFYSHFFPIANIWLQTNLTAYIGTNIAKNLSSRPRPYVYRTEISIEKKKETDAYKSFFSQHTSLTAANTFMAAHVITHYYNQKWIHYSAWSLAAILPTYVGYERVMAGKHFPTDVLAGFVWGATCGLIIPQLHTKKGNTDISFYAIHPSYVSLQIQW
ncbi:MAG: phosphatase PAP2 family protein [Bacteroidota bacterium]